ncbi:MAG TPA: ATP-binding protein, partial [Candidatus Limnocylindrales bacterium]|nr:ATP-binding protein [Candidatus Limnocylindrales bacterium]
VTEQKHAETALRERDEQLRQAQKMEAIGRLAGGVAHDFSNLLTIILGASERLLDRLPIGNPLYKDADSIRHSADRAAAMTQQLLAFSRQRVVAPTVLNLNDVLAGTERFLRPLIGEDIELRTCCAPDAGSVRADRTQIEQVLLNLAINARDAMPGGGRLTIEIENVDEKTAPPDLPLESGRYVLASVTDTGVGMDADTQTRAFEPFFTTKGPGKGTGLGLATVYGIVKQSGGFLAIRSAPGVGTRMMFCLPHVDDVATVRTAPTGPSAIERGHETVLLVEDEDGVRELVKDMLELAGYEVLEADQPGAAERICRAFSGTIHLLLTDVVMPETNGQELARRVLALRPAAKVLFMSGYPEQGAGGSVLAPGVHFIAKPFERRALLRRVRSVLDEAV